MKIDEMKTGDYVRWRADRQTIILKQWDTPAKVIKKSDDEVTLLTYDDFRRTVLHRCGDSIENELTPITWRKVPKIKILIGWFVILIKGTEPSE